MLDARGRPAAGLASLRSPAASPEAEEEETLAESAALKANEGEGYSSEGGGGLEADASTSSVSAAVAEHGDAPAFTQQVRGLRGRASLSPTLPLAHALAHALTLTPGSGAPSLPRGARSPPPPRQLPLSSPSPTPYSYPYPYPYPWPYPWP